MTEWLTPVSEPMVTVALDVDLSDVIADYLLLLAVICSGYVLAMAVWAVIVGTYTGSAGQHS